MTVTKSDREADPTVATRTVALPPLHGLLSAQARSAPAPLVGPPRSRPTGPALTAATEDRQVGPDADPRPASRVKEGLGIAGVMAIVVTAGVSLGFAWTSSDPLGIVDRATSAQAADTVGGLEGLVPGGPPAVVRLPVTNPGSEPLALTGVTPELSLLPSTCPSGAWLVSGPTLLPVVPALTSIEVPVTVALAADAPAGCQAIVSPLHATVSARAGGVATSVDTAATVSTGRLGSPGATVSLQDGAVRVTPTSPGVGPQPSGYTVDAVGPDGRHIAVCAQPVLAPCVDVTAPSAVRRGYVVTAHAGAGWRRDSAQVEVWTPPPTPALARPNRSAAGDPDLTVDAPAAGGGYQVTITVDGVPVARLSVPRNAPLHRSIRLHALSSGPHQAEARTDAHGVRATSAPLTFSRGATLP